MARKRKRTYSRLSTKERKRYARQTFLFSILTIILIAVIIIWGIPSLVKVAVFLGDLRSSSQPISGEDTIPPPPPVLQPLPDTATSSAWVRIEGFAEEGSTVTLSVNSSKVTETLVESDGEFLFNKVQLDAGDNRITAVAVDSAGNKSKVSTTQKIRYDANPPKLDVTSPEDRAEFFGNSEKVIEVSGITEPGARVTVNDNLVILSQDGSFSYNLNLSSGENVITVIAVDRAGNEIVDRRKVTFEE